MSTSSSQNGSAGRRARLPWRRKLVFALVVIVGVLAATELFCRFAVAIGLVTKPRSLREVWAVNGWIVDPLLGWALTPRVTSNHGGALARANRLGLRDEEMPVAKPPDEIRLLAIGDSTVLGFGIVREQTFSEQLEVLLKKRSGRAVQVINAGVPGYSSCQSMLYLRERGLALSPDVVIVETNFNDRRAVFAHSAPDSEEHFFATHRAILIDECLDRSMAVALFRELLFSGRDVLASGYFAGYREIDVDAAPRVSLPDYEANIREIVRLSREAGASVIFVGLLDEPKQASATRRGERRIERENWPEAERQLRGALEHLEVHAIPLQRLLNHVYRETGRVSEVRDALPITLANWMDMDGYTPVTMAAPYIDVLDGLSKELDVPLVVPRSELAGGREIYLDYIHLNATGHELLARQLAAAAATVAPFDAILDQRASRP